MQLNDEPLSYYDILELTADATPQEIRSAYLRLKSSYSKDNVANYSVYSREETDQLLQSIEEAYLILANPERRKAYDLSHQGEMPMGAMSGGPGAMSAHHIPAPVMPSISGGAPIPAQQPSSFANEPFFVHSESDILNAEQDWNGPAIKRARESKRISIEDLADYTRISKGYLMAIEEENYTKLPAIVYVRGFLQQISKRLKLPTESVVQKYIERLKAARPDKF